MTLKLKSSDYGLKIKNREAGVNIVTGRGLLSSPAGASGEKGESTGFGFTYDNAITMVDPTTGKFRLDNATPENATSVSISAVMANGHDVSSEIAALLLADTFADRGRLIIRSSGVYYSFTISDITDNTGWLELTLSGGSKVSASALVNAAEYSLFFETTSAVVGQVNSDANDVAVLAGQVTALAGQALTSAQLAEEAAARMIVQDWGSFQSSWQNNSPYAAFISKLGYSIYNDGGIWRRSVPSVPAEHQTPVLFGEKEFGAGFDWIDSFNDALVLDYENDIVFIRSQTAGEVYLNTFAHAVANKGVIDLTGGDFTVPLSLLGAYVDGAALTVFVEADTPDGTVKRLVSISGGMVSKSIDIQSRGTSANDPFGTVLGGASSGSMPSLGGFESRFKTMMRVDTNNAALVVGGVVKASDASVDIPTGLTSIHNRRRGDAHATLNKNSNDVHKIIIIPAAVSDADMQAYTS